MRQQRADRPTSTNARPHQLVITLRHLDDGRYELTYGILCGRQVSIPRAWVFDLDPGGEYPADVACDVLEALEMLRRRAISYEPVKLF